jgi:hypothetical protein
MSLHLGKEPDVRPYPFPQVLELPANILQTIFQGAMVAFFTDTLCDPIVVKSFLDSDQVELLPLAS